jgi:hypothetical protein
VGRAQHSLCCLRFPGLPGRSRARTPRRLFLDDILPGVKAQLAAAFGRVAAALFLSEGTVRNYLSEAIQKLGARNRVEAAHIARQKGWL